MLEFSFMVTYTISVPWRLPLPLPLPLLFFINELFLVTCKVRQDHWRNEERFLFISLSKSLTDCPLWSHSPSHVWQRYTNRSATTITIILRPLYRTSSVSQHPQLRTAGAKFTAHMLLLMATSAFRLDRSHQSTSQQCYWYLHHPRTKDNNTNNI